MSEKLRTDARVNRDRILEVARDMLTEDPDVSLNSIAKLAGVGAGTLYRHFPSREALVLGVYKNEIDAQVELASALLAQHQPLMAFRLWCDRLAQLGRVKHASRISSRFIQSFRPSVAVISNQDASGSPSRCHRRPWIPA